MSTVAVVVHARKTFGGGIGELRDTLDEAGVDSPLWYEVAKSKQAPRCAQDALDQGADLLFVWGGDGTVQRCVNVLAGTGVPVAILPAGTANLLARNLRIPRDVPGAVHVGLHGARRAIDTATVNGEHFAVFAGAGLDALMVAEADRGLKDRLGRAAYLYTGARNLRSSPVIAKVKVDGRKLFAGEITCLLVGNMSELAAGIAAFEGSRPDDGIVEVGVVTAKSALGWVRTLARAVLGTAQASPFVETLRGSSIRVAFDHPTAYELDGGVRGTTDHMRIKVRPGAITVCVPPEAAPTPEPEAAADP